MKEERTWIVETPLRGVQYQLVKALSRKEAEEKMNKASDYMEDIEDLDFQVTHHFKSKIIREDK